MIPKAKEYTLGMLNRRTYVYTLIKTIIVLFGKNRRDSLLNGVEELAKNFKSIKIR